MARSGASGAATSTTVLTVAGGGAVIANEMDVGQAALRSEISGHQVDSLGGGTVRHALGRETKVGQVGSSVYDHLNLLGILRSQGTRGDSIVPIRGADDVLPNRPPKTVYHQGDLKGGVTGNRPLSTSPDSDLGHYHPDGDLYRFNIPSDVYDRWILDGSIQPFMDYHLPSGTTRPEIRIMPPAFGQMNDFLVPRGGG